MSDDSSIGPCLSCGAPLGKRVLTKGELRLAPCQACQLVQTEEVWPLERYADWYRNTDEFASDTLIDEERFLARDRRELSRLEGQGGRGPLLDVGAGGGTAVRAGLERDWDVTAVELGEASAQRLEALGATVRREAIETSSLQAGQFGIIIMSHVLEHLPDPRGTLQTLWEALAPGGLIQIAVPNWQSGKRAVAGKRLGWIGVEHLSYFRPKQLESLVAEAGFEVVETRVLPYECRSDLDFAVSLAERIRLDRCLARFMGLEGGGLRDFVATRARTTAAPWRARSVVAVTHGFLALWPDRLLAMIGRGDEIRLTARRPSATS